MNRLFSVGQTVTTADRAVGQIDTEGGIMTLFGRDGHRHIADPDAPDTSRRCRRPKTEHAPAETAAMAAGPRTYAGVTRAEREALRLELAPNGLIFGAKR